jgi:ligand-binding SRPBCC domain-containing protein
MKLVVGHIEVSHDIKAMSHALSASFRFQIDRTGFLSYRLTTSQILPISREKAFEFFKAPENLCDVTPVWLDFCLLNRESNTRVSENAEFDYTVKWFGIKMYWKSRIVEYNSPEKFTDIQIKGPYRSWVHQHILTTVPEGTCMQDIVSYTVPLTAWLFHGMIIKKQLKDIFCYRAVKTATWANKRSNRM